MTATVTNESPQQDTKANRKVCQKVRDEIYEEFNNSAKSFFDGSDETVDENFSDSTNYVSDSLSSNTRKEPRVPCRQSSRKSLELFNLLDVQLNTGHEEIVYEDRSKSVNLKEISILHSSNNSNERQVHRQRSSKKSLDSARSSAHNRQHDENGTEELEKCQKDLIDGQEEICKSIHKKYIKSVQSDDLNDSSNKRKEQQVNRRRGSLQSVRSSNKRFNVDIDTVDLTKSEVERSRESEGIKKFSYKDLSNSVNPDDINTVQSSNHRNERQVHRRRSSKKSLDLVIHRETETAELVERQTEIVKRKDEIKKPTCDDSNDLLNPNEIKTSSNHCRVHKLRRKQSFRKSLDLARNKVLVAIDMAEQEKYLGKESEAKEENDRVAYEEVSKLVYPEQINSLKSSNHRKEYQGHRRRISRDSSLDLASNSLHGEIEKTELVKRRIEPTKRKEEISKCARDKFNDPLNLEDLNTSYHHRKPKLPEDLNTSYHHHRPKLRRHQSFKQSLYVARTRLQGENETVEMTKSEIEEGGFHDLQAAIDKQILLAQKMETAENKKIEVKRALSRSMSMEEPRKVYSVKRVQSENTSLDNTSNHKVVSCLQKMSTILRAGLKITAAEELQDSFCTDLNESFSCPDV